VILSYNSIITLFPYTTLFRSLDSNNHSVFLLYYHLVLVTKYRRKVLNVEISDYLKDHFIRLLEPKGITVEEWNHDGDHIHILFRSEEHTSELQSRGHLVCRLL